MATRLKVDRVRRGRRYLNLDLDLARASGVYGSPGPYLFSLRRCGAVVSALYPPPWRLGVRGVSDPIQIGLRRFPLSKHASVLPFPGGVGLKYSNGVYRISGSVAHVVM